MTTNRPGPRRSPRDGGYARGEEKRQRIIEAALRRFGEEGYEGASTRQIAQDAGVNPPALQYYFEGKEGLHAACAIYLGERFQDAMRDAYALADQVHEDSDPDTALQAFSAILDALADYLFEADETGRWSRFLARGQGEDSAAPAYSAIKQRVGDELHGHCCRLVGLIVGRPPTEPEVKLRTFSILGQLLIFHLSRANALDRLGWPDLRGPRLQQLKTLIRTQTRAALLG